MCVSLKVVVKIDLALCLWVLWEIVQRYVT